MKTNILLSFLLTFSGTVSLRAAEAVDVAGDRYPKTLEYKDITWELQGTHHYKYKIVFSVFSSALYHQADGEGKRLQFTYSRDLKAEDLREQAMKTLKAANDKQTLEKWAVLTQQIQQAYDNVSEDDSYTITVIPDRGAWLDFNEKNVFHTDNAEFGFWYLDIWLGDDPISEDLKEALTGKS